MVDPMEQKIEDALRAAHLDFECGPAGGATLDFWVPTKGVHIEVKQFHSERIGKQMAQAPNVIVAQGAEAVEWLAAMIRCWNVQD